jgi:hypothetical protein
LAFLVLIGLGGYSFFKSDVEPTAPSNVESAATETQPAVENQLKEVTEQVVAIAVPGAVNAAENATQEAAEKIDLTFLEAGAGWANVQRETVDSEFVITAVADLPFIDDATQAYEIWLVKPGVTDFFSVGEMFRREDGKWGLIWKVDPQAFAKDVSEFTRVIITREQRDGVPSPSTAHVMQGDFSRP